jgi:antitoxin HicB
VNATRTYTIILEPMHEGGFLVRVLALPEVVTGGDTEDEALAMAKEAIELVLASRRERGEEIPAESGKPQVREVTVSTTA